MENQQIEKRLDEILVRLGALERRFELVEARLRTIPDLIPIAEYLPRG